MRIPLKSLRLLALGVAALLPVSVAWSAREVALQASSQGPLRVMEVAAGLELPWSLAFLPDGRLLVSERPGRLRLVSPSGELSPPLAGVPRVYAQGQGGLLDVVLSPDFSRDRRIYFSAAQPADGGARTAVFRARLDADGGRLSEVEQIFAQQDVMTGGNHFGSRLVFGRDGNLFVTLGDRYSGRDKAQALDSHLGKVVRIRPDGGIPADNPLLKRPGALPEIWSWGHRNVQGAALHPVSGRLWTHEHGPQGGDEVNVDLGGHNYGWPVITFGREYVTGFRIGEGSSRADVTPPLHQWTPSIAPSGMSFYTGKAFPAWQGSLFVGALKFQLLSRLSLDGERVTGEERLLEGIGRIRDVRQGPDGLLYLLDESNGRILRLEPGR